MRNIIFLNLIAACFTILGQPEGTISYLNVEYDVYKYVPSRKTLNGFVGYLNTGNRVQVVCLPPTTNGVLELTNVQKLPMHKRLLGDYNNPSNNARCYVFLQEMPD